jgi:hypothetical protein
LRREREAHGKFGAGEKIDIGRDEGRRIDEAEARLAEQAMDEVGGVVPLQIRLDLGFIGHFGLCEAELPFLLGERLVHLRFFWRFRGSGVPVPLRFLTFCQRPLSYRPVCAGRSAIWR